MTSDFSNAHHTIVLSDIHLADAEPEHPYNPLWKRYKRREFFIDNVFADFLHHIEKTVPGPIELVLNGDIFDFDSIMALPAGSKLHVSWLERMRGLASEEAKSRFKMQVIIADHPVWFEAIREFILKGNRVIFVFGNHDIELHWPSVRQDIIDHLRLPQDKADLIRFCEWFYISNKDTLIEHGNQYDAYSLCSNPINPLIKKGGKVYVRIPFGNLAGKFMLNGMGLFNPHADTSFIKGSIRDYMVFYARYVFRTQPMLLWTWFWSAMVTGIYSISEGLLPAMTDPITIDSRVEDIAQRSNANARMVWALKELHVHPAIYNPFKILRELWLDRAIVLALILIGSFEIFASLNVFMTASLYWFFVPVALLMPMFIFYARSVESEVAATQRAAFHNAPIAARITQVRRVIQGHTHLERHTTVEGIDYINTGTWSPAYQDVECSMPYGRKCFAWIKPGQDGKARASELYEWKEGKAVLVPSDQQPVTANPESPSRNSQTA